MNVILLISVMALGLSALTEANLPRIDPCDAFAHPALVLVRSSAQTSCPGSMCAGGCCLFVNGTCCAEAHTCCSATTHCLEAGAHCARIHPASAKMVVRCLKQSDSVLASQIRARSWAQCATYP